MTNGHVKPELAGLSNDSMSSEQKNNSHVHDKSLQSACTSPSSNQDLARGRDGTLYIMTKYTPCDIRHSDVDTNQSLNTGKRLP